MSHLNIDMLQQKAADIARARKILDKYGAIPRHEFLKDETIISAAKYQLIVATEAAQSICNHLAARVAKRAPASYSDCYLILRDEGLISEHLAARLAEMVKFRNLLVHRYGIIDNNKVYDIITAGNLNDLTDFLAEVGKLAGGKL